MSDPESGLAAELAGELWSLFVDRVTAVVTERLEGVGIASVLLKGAAFAALLYDQPRDRSYTDTDLLIDPADCGRAEELLVEMGFVRVDRDEDWLGPEPKYAHTFFRESDSATVDLHWRLSGATCDSQVIWTAMRRHTARLVVGGRRVDVVDASASALLVALHNAHHGTERPGTLSDLDRAVDVLDLEIWRDAVRLADELQAREPFAAGLRLTEAGSVLADRLGLERLVSVEMWLKTNPTSYGAFVLDRFHRTHSMRGRLKLCLRVAIPPRVVMYRFFPLARRGWVGLLIAYLLRPLHLFLSSGPALRDIVRARRHLRSSSRPWEER